MLKRILYSLLASVSLGCFANVATVITVPPQGTVLSQVISTSKVSSNGKYFAYSATTTDSTVSQLFVTELSTQTTQKVSLSTDKKDADAAIYNVRLSADGKTVFFVSSASNLTADTSTEPRIFAYNLATKTFKTIKDNQGNAIQAEQLSFVLRENGNALFIFAESEHLITEAADIKMRIYRHTVSTNSLSVVIDDFDDMRAEDISSDGDKILISTTQELDTDIEVSEWSRKLYVFDVSDKEYSYIRAGEFLGYHTPYLNSKISEDGRLVFLTEWRGDSLLTYNTADKTLSEGKLAVCFERHSCDRISIKSVNSDGSLLLIEHKNKLWQYTPSTNLGSIVSVDSSESVVETPGDLKSAYFSYDQNTILFTPKNAQTDLTKVQLGSLTTTAPGPPSSIQQSERFFDRIELSWTSDASHFIVKRAFDSGEFEALATIDDNALYDSGRYASQNDFNASKSVSYTIQACSQRFICSSATTFSNATLSLPPAISDLTIKPSEQQYYGSLLQWSDIKNATYKVHLIDGRDRSENTAYRSEYRLSSSSNSTEVKASVSACFNTVCGEKTNISVPIQPNYSIEDFGYLVNDQFTEITLMWSDTVPADFFRISVQDKGKGTYSVLANVTESEYVVKFPEQQFNSDYFLIQPCTNDDHCSKGKRVYVDSFNTMAEFDRSSFRLSVKTLADGAEISLPQHNSNFERVKLYRQDSALGKEELVDSQEMGIGNPYSFIDLNVEAGKAYYYRADVCLNQTCRSSNNLLFSGLNGYAAQLGEVKNLTASGNVYQDRIALSWEPIVGADSINLIRDIYPNQNDSYAKTIKLDGDVTSYQDFDVHPGNQYQYRIQAQRNKLMGTLSAPAIGSIDYDTGLIVEPEVITPRTDLNAHSTRIFFYHDVLDQTDYVEYYISDNEEGPFEKVREVSSKHYSDANYTIRSLTPGTTKFAKVKNCSIVACSEFSQAVKGRTADFTKIPQSTVTAPSLRLNADRHVEVAFELVEDASYYQIKRRSIDSGYEWTFNSNKSPLVDGQASSGKTYAYSVTPCNQIGCNAQSDETTYQFEPLDRRFGIHSASTSDQTSITIDLRDLSSSYGQRPTVKLYSSTSLGGVKTKIGEISSESYQSRFNVENTAANTPVYFWLENCFDDDCTMSDLFDIGQRIEPDTSLLTPPVMSVHASRGLTSIDFRFDSVPAGVSRTLYWSETVESDKQPIYSSTNLDPNIESIRIDEEDYVSKERVYWAKNCYQEECSDFSNSVSAALNPRHTNKILGDKNQQLVYSRNYASLKDKEAILLSRYSPSQTLQKLHIGNGAALKFQLFLEESNAGRCEQLVSLDTTVERDNQTTSFMQFKKELVTIYRGGNACSDHPFTDSNFLYGVMGQGESSGEILKIDVSSHHHQWINVELLIDKEFNAQLSVLNKKMSSKALPNLALLAPEFIGFDFKTGVNGVWLGDIEFEGTPFSTQRPDPLTSSSFRYSRYDQVFNVHLGTRGISEFDQHAYRTRVFKVEETGQLTEVESDTSTLTQGHTYYDLNVAENGNYVFSAAVCDASRCSSEDVLLGGVDSLSTLLNIVATAIPARQLIQLDFDAVNVDQVKLYTGQTPESLTLYNSNVESGFKITGVTTPELYISLQACEDETCAEALTPVLVSMNNDYDEDGLSNELELSLGTDPYRADTDEDGLSDFDEVQLQTDPLNPDTDGDGIIDSKDPDTYAGNASGDINGDGKGDILWRNQKDGRNWLWTMNGMSVLKSAGINTISDQDWKIVGRGDFDGDGVSDVLWRHAKTGRNWLYLMEGFGIKVSTQLNYVTDTDWQIKATGDFDGDGKDDILWRHARRGDTWVYLMNGSQIRLSKASKTVSDLNWKITATGDVNGDGKDDVIWRHQSSGDNYIWLMKDHRLQRGYVLNTISRQAWTIAGSGDINGDGTDDILWRNQNDGRNWAYLMNNGQIETSKQINTVANKNWQITDIVDLDGDGKDDLFWRQSNTGQTYIYLMDGVKLKSANYGKTVSINWQNIAN